MIIGKNFMFVHVPKTGGTSIASILEPYREPQTDPSHYFDEHDILFTAWRMMDDNRFKSLYKFGFVRNPFDREVSNYFWHTRVNVQSQKDISFSDWVEWRYNISDKVKQDWFADKNEFYYNKGFGKNPQVGYFVNSYGDVMADYIGRFETLPYDWVKISSRLGFSGDLPHKYQSKMRSIDYRGYYTDRLVDIVGKAHQLDLMAFNYDFEQGMISDKICQSTWRLNGRHDLSLTPLYTYYYG